MRPATSTSTRACSGCGWSRRRSTRTTRASTTSSTPTSMARPAPTSPSSSIPARSPDAPAPGWSPRSSIASAARRRSTSGAGASPSEGVEVVREAGRLRFADPEGMNHELALDQTDDAALDGALERGPGGVRAAGLRLRPRARRRSRRQRGAAGRHARLLRVGRARLAGAWRAPRRADRLRAERGARRSRRRHRAPHRLVGHPRRAGAVARARDRRPAPTPRRSSTASTSSRSTSASPAASSTSSRRSMATASPRTKPPETLGQQLALPPRLEPHARADRAPSRALPDTSRWRSHLRRVSRSRVRLDAISSLPAVKTW